MQLNDDDELPIITISVFVFIATGCFLACENVEEKFDD